LPLTEFIKSKGGVDSVTGKELSKFIKGELQATSTEDFSSSFSIFCLLKSFFPKNASASLWSSKHISLISSVSSSVKAKTADICSSLEVYYSTASHADGDADDGGGGISDYPLVLKKLYDADVVDETSLIKR
jgi:hypothetical protein